MIKKMFLLVVLMLMTAIGVQASGPDAHSITSSWAEINGNMVVTYVVQQDGSLNGISHFVVPDGCPLARLSVSGCQDLDYGTDPTTGVTGIKCDESGPRTLVVKYAGELMPGTGMGAIKYGNNVAYFPDLDTMTCEPQSVVIEVFEYIDGAFHWVTGFPDGRDYQVKVVLPGARTSPWVTPVIQGGNVGGIGGEYRVKPLTGMVDGATYELWAHDIYNAYGVAASFVYNKDRSIILDEFTATVVEDDDVLLFWRTDAEDPITRFYLWRASDQTGEKMIHEEKGQNWNGAKYEYLDQDLPPGSYTYTLEATGELGDPHQFLTANVVIAPPTAVKLKEFSAGG